MCCGPEKVCWQVRSLRQNNDIGIFIHIGRIFRSGIKLVDDRGHQRRFAADQIKQMRPAGGARGLLMYRSSTSARPSMTMVSDLPEPWVCQITPPLRRP
jgi:hypothetical protein